jgi:hypothetical protein
MPGARLVAGHRATLDFHLDGTEQEALSTDSGHDERSGAAGHEVRA